MRIDNLNFSRYFSNWKDPKHLKMRRYLLLAFNGILVYHKPIKKGQIYISYCSQFYRTGPVMSSFLDKKLPKPQQIFSSFAFHLVHDKWVSNVFFSKCLRKRASYRSWINGCRVWWDHHKTTNRRIGYRNIHINFDFMPVLVLFIYSLNDASIRNKATYLLTRKSERAE